MCMRSPSAPKYSISVSGSTLASASTMQSPCRHCRNSRKRRSMSYCSWGLPTFGSFGRDDERHRIHPEAGNAQLNPEPHDLENLGLHLRMRGIEVGLEVIETMEIPGFGLLVVAPSRLLHPRKHHAVVGARRLLLRP